MTTLVENQKLIERYFNDVWNEGDIDLLDEIISPEYINHSPGINNPSKGPEGLKPIVMAMRIGFPDLHFRIEDMVVTEQKVAIRSTMIGTHLGDFFGMQSTGKYVEINQLQIEHIKGGKIIEHWRQSDDLGLMT